MNNKERTGERKYPLWSFYFVNLLCSWLLVQYKKYIQSIKKLTGPVIGHLTVSSHKRIPSVSRNIFFLLNFVLKFVENPADSLFFRRAVGGGNVICNASGSMSGPPGVIKGPVR